MTTSTALPLCSGTGLVPANDNHKQSGHHEWPAYDRLSSGRLMRSAEGNRVALAALVRLRQQITEAEGYGEQWTASSDSSAVDEDVADRFGDDLIIERVTAEHLVALHATGSLEYRMAPNGQVLPFKKDGAKVYQLEDRYRGERGSAKPEHPSEIEDELNGRYSGAAWPKAPGAATSARHLFSGAQMKVKAAPRVCRSIEEPIVARMYAERCLAFLQGGIPAAIWQVLVSTATGATAEAVGEARGHRGKYASAVGTELQRIALESLVDCYADFDGCHQEVA